MTTYFEDKLIGIAAWRLLRIAEGKDEEVEHEELLQAIEDLFVGNDEKDTASAFLRVLKSEFHEGDYPEIEQLIEEEECDAIFGHLFSQEVNKKLLTAILS